MHADATEFRQLPSMDVINFAFVLLSLALCLILAKAAGKPAGARLPPGPWQLPVIGSLHHLWTLRPHLKLRELSEKYGPVMFLQLGEIPAVVISGVEEAKEALTTHDLNLAYRPKLIICKAPTYDYSSVSFAPYGEYWRQLKKLCLLELLTAKRVDSFRTIREEEVQRLLAAVRGRGGAPLNMTMLLTAFLNDVTARAAFGERSRQQQVFVTTIRDGVRALAPFLPIALFPSWRFMPRLMGFSRKEAEICSKLDGVYESIIDDHRRRRQVLEEHPAAFEEDLLDVLMRLKQEGQLQVPFTEDNLKAIMLDMFTGGTETSSSTLSWVMTELVRNPTVMAKAQQEVRKTLKGSTKVTEARFHELSYLKLVIKETLRLHPAVPLLIPRESLAAFQINGYQIPAKTYVFVNVWAILRDQRHWGDDAESFRPERFLNSSLDFKGASFKYIPFGAGRRMCPGIRFALANIEMAVAHLLYWFEWRLPKGVRPEDVDTTDIFGLASRQRKDLHLVAVPYEGELS